MHSASPTQCEIILQALKSRIGQWVAMPDLATEAGCFAVHSRISDLREAGYRIETKIEGHRPRKSFYRLLSMEPAAPETTTDQREV